MSDINKKIFTGLNLQQNELQNAVVHNSATAPLQPLAGQQYFNTASNKLYIYDGTEWVDTSTHTISNVVVDATAITLAQYVATSYNTADFAEGDTLILSAATDPEQRAWINLGTDNGDETDFAGLSIAYDSTEIKALFNAGTGLTYADGVFSVTEKGIETTQLADNAVTNVKLADDAVNTTEIVDGAVTQAKLDSTLASKIVNGYKTTVGDGIADTFNVTHNLGTEDISCSFWAYNAATTKWEMTDCFAAIDSSNSITVSASPAPANNGLRIIIKKAILA